MTHVSAPTVLARRAILARPRSKVSQSHCRGAICHTGDALLAVRRQPDRFPLPYVILAFVSFLWGSSFLLIKIASRTFDPASVAFGRAAIAAAALIVAALAMRLTWPRELRVWGRMAAMALFGQALPFLLLGAAARLTTSADMALMMGGVPIFTFVLARLFALGEVWNARAALGLGLGLLGVVVSLGAPLGAAPRRSANRGLDARSRCWRRWATRRAR